MQFTPIEKSILKIASYTKPVGSEGITVKTPLNFQGFSTAPDHLDRHLKIDGPAGSILINKDGSQLSVEQRAEVAKVVDAALADDLAKQLEAGADTAKPIRSEIRNVKLSEVLPGLIARDAVLDIRDLPSIAGTQSLPAGSW
jgi:hypothetical protein